jgi:hypothetical protein
MTMPHLAFAASQLARFLTNPGLRHFSAALRVFAYLRGNDRDLVFVPNGDRGLDTFVDSVLIGLSSSLAADAWSSITVASSIGSAKCNTPCP